ncbi:MAG: TolC family protein [Synergistaceae bacterium]|jgi:outer membrane protein TolC|nr:TolC family protein [Synergistaceae bacterium]
MLRGKAHKISSILLILTALLQGAPARAAEPLGVKEAIALTLENNSALLSLRQEISKASALKIQADGTATPEIGFNTYIDENKDLQTSDGSSRRDNRVARITLEQSVYSGGRNQALRRQSLQARSIAELNLIDAQNRATGELFARFYNVLLQDRLVEAERSAIATGELHLREITRMNELGLSNRLEVIRASQQLAANRANLSAAQGLYESAVISLMNYMAIPPEERRAVDGDLGAMDARGDRASSLAEATNNRADLAALEKQIEYQKDQIEIERSALRPRVTLGASAGLLNPYDREDTGNETWRAELSITVPILDRNQARGGIMRAQATAEQDRIALSQKGLDIKSEVETAWAELESTRNRLESAALALELAEETLRLAEVGFQEGVTPQLDLLSAQTSLTESRLEYLRSLYNNMIAVVALKVTEGNIIDWAREMEFE